MLSKCANPQCSVPFRYLHEGRIFSVHADVDQRHITPPAIVERYWLCSTCSNRLTLVLRNGQVTLKPLRTWDSAA